MTLRNASLLFALGLFACSDGDTDPGTDTDSTDTDTNTDCTSSSNGSLPEADATGIYFKSPVEVYFKQDETDTASFSMADADGNDIPVTATFADEGEVAILDYGDALSPSTTYTVSVAYSCDKAFDFSFTTSEVGDPVTGGGEALIDNVYLLDIATARVTEPAEVGSLLEGLLATQDINVLVSPTAYDSIENTLAMRGALGVDSDGAIVQDVCSPSINFPVAADFVNDPEFAILAPEGIDIEIDSETSISLGSLTLSGAFSPDGQNLAGVSLSGSADLRDLEALIEASTVCSLAPGICQDCGDGSETCINLTLDSVEAELNGTEGLALIDSDNLDVGCDEE